MSGNVKLEVEAVPEVSLLVKISLLDLLKDLKHTSYHFVDTHIIHRTLVVVRMSFFLSPEGLL